jgi:hypothetical protein
MSVHLLYWRHNLRFQLRIVYNVTSQAWSHRICFTCVSEHPEIFALDVTLFALRQVSDHQLALTNQIANVPAQLRNISWMSQHHRQKSMRNNGSWPHSVWLPAAAVQQSHARGDHCMLRRDAMTSRIKCQDVTENQEPAHRPEITFCIDKTMLYVIEYNWLIVNMHVANVTCRANTYRPNN